MAQQKKSDKPKTIDEQRLFTKDFGKPIVLVTYEGNEVIKESVEIEQYKLFIDTTELPKIEVMFAFPYANYATIKSGVSLRKSVADLNLSSIEKIGERPFVATYFDFIEGTKKNVRITMRTGHTLTGFQYWASKYHILLMIERQPVLVYKHGIYAYQIEDRDELISKPKIKKEDLPPKTPAADPNPDAIAILREQGLTTEVKGE